MIRSADWGQRIRAVLRQHGTSDSKTLIHESLPVLGPGMKGALFEAVVRAGEQSGLAQRS
jgi:hypothetical protein